MADTLSAFSQWPEYRGKIWGISGVSLHSRAVRSAQHHVHELRVPDRCHAFLDTHSKLDRQRFADHDSWQTNHHVRGWFPATAEQHNVRFETRGTFNFTGFETGNDFSDYLLGLPYQTSAVTYLNNNDARYLRETVANGFATDDYRVLSNLTINGGLRWEYFSPYTEKHGQMANLDIAPGFTAVSQVLPGQAGPYSGAFPQGFIKPDYKLFSPRIGIAWKPWKSKQIVVRSGYGVYYNGSVYGQIASRLVGQPPFATTTQLFQSTATPLSLENGFPLEESDLIANTFAVDKNYHPGYAQNWTTSIQETFARVYVLTVAYNGVKGTGLDVLQLPNRSPLGTPQLQVQSNLMIPNTGEFTYDNSIGNSTYNAAQVSIARRFSRGASFAILYTYSKAIDDSSTLGGGPVLIPNDIGGERSALALRSAAYVARELQFPIADRQYPDGLYRDHAAGMGHRRRPERYFRHAVYGCREWRHVGHGLYRKRPRERNRAAGYFQFGHLQYGGVHSSSGGHFRRMPAAIPFRVFLSSR